MDETKIEEPTPEARESAVREGINQLLQQHGCIAELKLLPLTEVPSAWRPQLVVKAV